MADLNAGVYWRGPWLRPRARRVEWGEWLISGRKGFGARVWLRVNRGMTMSGCFVGALGLAVIAGALLALPFPRTGDQSWLAFGALVPLLVAVDGAP